MWDCRSCTRITSRFCGIVIVHGEPMFTSFMVLTLAYEFTFLRTYTYIYKHLFSIYHISPSYNTNEIMSQGTRKIDIDPNKWKWFHSTGFCYTFINILEVAKGLHVQNEWLVATCTWNYTCICSEWYNKTVVVVGVGGQSAASY